MVMITTTIMNTPHDIVVVVEPIVKVNSSSSSFVVAVSVKVKAFHLSY